MGRTWRRRRCKNNTNNAPSLNNDPNIVNLLKTLKAHNWDNETQLQLRHFSLTGRGVCSNSKITTDAILIKIPINAMITLATFKKETINLLFRNKHVTLPMQTLLSLFLCIEKYKCSEGGVGSEWKFYLDSLPNCNPLTWLQLTPSEVRHFPAHVAERMEKFRATFARSWDSVVEAINPTLMHRMINVDLFAWCYAMINTRGVFIDPAYIRRHAAEYLLQMVKDEPNIGLCPFLDMFNHSTEAKTCPEIFRQNNQDYYVLRSHKNHQRYEQIFISYGAHDNCKLFVEYGFFIPENHFDIWPIPFKELCKYVSFDSKTYKYILSKGFDRELYVSRLGELSFNLKACLFVSRNEIRDFDRVYRDDYNKNDIDWFVRIVCRLMDVQLTLLTPKHFDDAVTHMFYEYLINFPINLVK